ncbi:RidA family protein [Paraburkholderia xenovorans]|uniref:RidA family protein n=1 Tax=Paraburkholderia xenovorans TaxID=36873 RepID=UPI0038BC727B
MPTPKPYSDAVSRDGWIYLSGKTGAVSDGTLPEDFALQSVQAMLNVRDALLAAKASLSDVVKVTVFLTSMDDYSEFNEIYVQFFPETKPARSCVAVSGLPRGAKVEVEAVAFIDGPAGRESVN